MHIVRLLLLLRLCGWGGGLGRMLLLLLLLRVWGIGLGVLIKGGGGSHWIEVHVRIGKVGGGSGGV